MYPTTAAHYHNGTDFYCRAHRYPPCPGCGAPRPRRKGGEFHSDHSVFNQPVWLCSTCKTADVENNRKCDTRLPAGLLQCYQCKERKPRAEFGEGVTHQLRDKWRCLQCQYPRCVQCYTTRPRSLRPTTAITREYTCERCAETYKCGTCGDLKPGAAYDSTHLSNHLKHGRDLRCESCRANPTSKTYTCGACGKPKPPEAYDSTHLSHHLHHDRPLRCEDCKSKRDKQTYKCHRCDGQYFPREHFHKKDLNIFCSVRRWS